MSLPSWSTRVLPAASMPRLECRVDGSFWSHARRASFGASGSRRPLISHLLRHDWSAVTANPLLMPETVFRSAARRPVRYSGVAAPLGLAAEEPPDLPDRPPDDGGVLDDGGHVPPACISPFRPPASTANVDTQKSRYE
jgi:hypothetical protein